MRAFTFERPDSVAAAANAVADEARREVHRGRHQPARSHEARGREADPPRGRQPAAARVDLGNGRRRLADRRAGPQQRSGRGSPRSEEITACSAAPCCRAPRVSCATRPPRRATCCNARAAIISTTRRNPATSVIRGPGCSALEGFNRIHAIVGASGDCIAVASLRHGGRDAGAGREGGDDPAGRQGGSDSDRRTASAARIDRRRSRLF